MVGAVFLHQIGATPLKKCPTSRFPSPHFIKQIATLFCGIFNIPTLNIEVTSFLSTLATKEKKQKNAAYW